MDSIGIIFFAWTYSNAPAHGIQQEFYIFNVLELFEARRVKADFPVSYRHCGILQSSKILGSDHFIAPHIKSSFVLCQLHLCRITHNTF